MMKIQKNVGKKLEVQLMMNGINGNHGNVINVTSKIEILENLLLIQYKIIIFHKHNLRFILFK